LFSVNEAPVITTTAFGSIAENQTAIGSLAVTDDTGDSVAFTITGGDDQGKFTVSGSTLAFNFSPNFESPADTGTNNVYEVQITATDGDGLTDIETVSVTVVSVNEAPVITTTAFGSIAENQTAIGSLAVTDDTGDSVTFTITGGDDQGKFTVSGSTLAFNFSPDFDIPVDTGTNNVYEVQITATDGDALTDSRDCICHCC
jgi:ribosomal protein S6E (S10)